MRRIKRSGRRANRLRVLAVVVLLLAAALTAVIDIRVRPMLKTYGVNQATTTATKAVNDAVERVLAECGLQYADLAAVTKNEDGTLASIQTNTANMNRLKAAVSSAVLEELDHQDMQTVRIPIGTILSGGLLTGLGPRLSIRVPMNSTVETTYENVFEGAGINQTRHEITIRVKVKVYAMIPGDNTETEVDTGFTIAETVLIGEVPQWAILGSAENS